MVDAIAGTEKDGRARSRFGYWAIPKKEIYHQVQYSTGILDFFFITFLDLSKFSMLKANFSFSVFLKIYKYLLISAAAKFAQSASHVGMAMGRGWAGD